MEGTWSRSESSVSILRRSILLSGADDGDGGEGDVDLSPGAFERVVCAHSAQFSAVILNLTLCQTGPCS